jgi:hypothetical protein
MFQLAVKPTRWRYLRVWKTSILDRLVSSDGLLILQLCHSRLVIGSVTLAAKDSADSPQTLCKCTQTLVTCTPNMYSSNLGRNIDYPDNDFIFPRFLLPRVMTG